MQNIILFSLFKFDAFPLCKKLFHIQQIYATYMIIEKYSDEDIFFNKEQKS